MAKCGNCKFFSYEAVEDGYFCTANRVMFPAKREDEACKGFEPNYGGNEKGMETNLKVLAYDFWLHAIATDEHSNAEKEIEGLGYEIIDVIPVTPADSNWYLVRPMENAVTDFPSYIFERDYNPNQWRR